VPVIADLHLHSRFSRATSRDLDFGTLHRAALEKGITLLGTGDVTHPEWLSEIESSLEPAEPGLFRLRPELASAAEEGLPAACAGRVRFVLQVEISNIYKKAERVRKNHNLVYLPSLEAAHRFTERLATIGNLASDGRPILGLDARDLLEITLETDPRAFLIPAHIWTPWFSMLGSKSGFDSLEECFGDLAGFVFAAETGLSSDPPMNWRVSSLDRLTLVSNSDAHSTRTLGREANLLDIELGYEPLYRALTTGEGFLGTIEFYPEEGKYHLDGHRKCGIRLDPEETRRLDGRCPECGGRITVGVMSRVLELADRGEGFQPETAAAFQRLVPLDEAVGQALEVGTTSKRVRTLVCRLLTELGPEITILRDQPLEDIARAGGPVLAEAVRRIRQGELTIAAGYDGAFGAVQVFAPGERDRLAGQLAFFPAASATAPAPDLKPASRPTPKASPTPRAGRGRAAADATAELDADQRAAVEAPGPLLVVAGPGTGKTRTLVERIARQVRSGGVDPSRILAIAFTNQAADEVAARIRRQVPGATDTAPLVTTFHSLGLAMLTELTGTQPEIVDDTRRSELVRRAAGRQPSDRDVRALLARISLAKQSCDPWMVLTDQAQLLPVISRYQDLLEDGGAVDVDDLVLRPYQLLTTDPMAAARMAARWTSICIDEYQDVNDVQAALVALLSPDGRSLCAIGDPDQSIYGFRGARPGHFGRFSDAYPGTTLVRLRTSYRLTREILKVARALVTAQPGLRATAGGPRVEVVPCASAAGEAEQIVVRLERILGGSSHFAVDSGRADGAEAGDIGFGDVAVLSRTRAQHKDIRDALDRSGFPCHTVGEDEVHDPRSQKVAVMTMHAAKGREFEVVFVTGVEHGLLPLEREGATTDPDEERRLLYVAMTRARRVLVLSWAAHRTLWGRRLPGAPSPFLTALPTQAVTRPTPATPKAEKVGSRQLRLF
jgi:DNA helicase-2/ATP-dependent DNA helicase PcrA